MRFFITGISGFAGSHLAAHLIEAGHSVFGLAHRAQSRALERLRARYDDRFPVDAVAAADVRDGARVRECLRRAKPDGIFHLAGVAFVPRALKDPRAAYEINFFGSLELLEAAREAAPKARIVFPTSGEIYGPVDPSELPITEEHPLRPVSPYSVGKAAADLAAFQQFWTNGLDVVRVRPFNHTGPGQSPDFVCSEFARTVVAVERGLADPVLRTGNVEAERDFSDVRDVVRAYASLFEKGVAGEAYNLASGRTLSVRSMLDRLIEQSRARIAVETDPGKLRPREVPRVEVSIAKIGKATGWHPQIPLERTLEDLLAYWREEIHS